MSKVSGTLASLAESRSSLAEFFSDLAGSLGACSQATKIQTEEICLVITHWITASCIILNQGMRSQNVRDFKIQKGFVSLITFEQGF